MKNIKLLFLFSVLTMLFACDADYEPLNDYSDVDWYTSKNRNEKLVGVNDYMSFADLSQNSIDHSWSFSDTSGCYFLKGNIVRQDSTFTQFIDEDLDNVSYDKSISVLFTKPGLQGIRLKNTFPSPVTFEGADTLVAVQQGDVWVIDTTFVVDVYDTIQSSFKVFKGDLEIANVDYDQQSVLADSASWPIVEIEAGAALKFVDMTEIGRPNTFSWKVGGGSPSTSADSAAVINFYRLGTYYANHTASRSGENIPSGYKFKYVPLKIKVIKSTLPFEVVGQVTELESEIIQIAVTGEIDPFFNKEDLFTVHVTNPNGFNEDVAINSVSVNSTQGNLLDIKLVNPIYNTDVITISYSGDEIFSLDERTLQTFTGVPVAMHKPNVLPDASFENANVMWKNGLDHDSSNFTEFVKVDPTDGEFVYHTHRIGDKRTSIWSSEFNMTEGKKYKLEWDVKTVQTGGYWNGYEIRFAKESFFDPITGGETTGPAVKFWVPTRDADNLWRTESNVFNFTAPTADDFILHIITYTPNAELYMDNFVIYVYEERP